MFFDSFFYTDTKAFVENFSMITYPWHISKAMNLLVESAKTNSMNPDQEMHLIRWLLNFDKPHEVSLALFN